MTPPPTDPTSVESHEDIEEPLQYQAPPRAKGAGDLGGQQIHIISISTKKHKKALVRHTGLGLMCTTVKGYPAPPSENRQAFEVFIINHQCVA